MTRMILGMVAAVLLTGSNTEFACGSEARPATVPERSSTASPTGSAASIPSDVRGLITQAHGAAPILCAIAADGLSNWGGRWDDAPAPPLGLATRERARSMPDGSELTPSEVRLLSDSVASSDPCVRELSVRLLGRFGGDAVVERFTALLGSSTGNAGLRAAAALGLGMAGGKSAVPELIRALRDDDADVRANAVWALGRTEDGRSVAPIRDLMTDESVAVRQASAVALGRLDSVSSGPVLERALRQDRADGVRRNAAWALGEIEARTAGATLATAARSDKDAGVREMAAWAIANAEIRDQAPVLVQALARDSSDRARETAAWALGSLEARDAVDALGEAAGTDPRPRVRGAAAWALGQIAPPAAPRGLIKAVADADVDVRTKAAWALSEIRDSTAVSAVRDAFRRETDRRARRAQVRAMMRSGKGSQDALGEMLRSMDPEVRKAAVRGLAGDGGVDVWPWPWPRPRPIP